MAFGIQTFGPNGELYFDGSKRALRVVHHQTVAGSFTGNIMIPNKGITPYTHAAFCRARTDMPFKWNLLAQVIPGGVNLTRHNNSYTPQTVQDLVVLGFA